MDKQTKLSPTNKTVQEHWMPHELEEPVAAGRAINDEQIEATVELIHAYKTLKETHNALVHKLQKLTVGTETSFCPSFCQRNTFL